MVDIGDDSIKAGEEEMEVDTHSSKSRKSREEIVKSEENNCEEMKTRHLLEIIACAGEGTDQLISIVHQSVHDQLRNWGIEIETSRTTRGRSKNRKSNSTKAGGGSASGRSELGYNRLVEANLTNWKVSVKVPILIKQACDFLRAHVKTEGIFRKSGSASRVQALMQRFANLDKHEELTFGQSDTVFDVATVLKQYLREMDAPLIPFDIHNLFRKCLEVPSESSREEAVLLCSCLLPESNISILTYLIEFLMEVVESSSENRMSFENLAIVIGPNIMPVDSKKVDKTKELENERKFIEAHTKIVELLIRNGERLGCIPAELQKKIDGDIAARSEDELEQEGNQRRKKRRSGSLTRVLGFLRKVTNKTGDTPVAQTPVDFNDFTHTPVIKGNKRRCLDENMFSLQKNPMKSEWKQTPNASASTGRFKNLVTPSLLRRKEKNVAELLKNTATTTTPFSAPAKPFKARVAGLGKKSKKQAVAAATAILTDNNGSQRDRRTPSSEVKRIASVQSIHKLAQSPRKQPVVARAASTRIPRPDKVIPVRKSNSSCRFPITSPREARILDGTPVSGSKKRFNNKNVSGLSGEYVRISPRACLNDEKNEAFIASKISCLEETTDSGQENNQPGQGDPSAALRLTPLIQEITSLTLSAQQEDLTLSGLRKKRSVSKLSPAKGEKVPPVPSRATRRRSSGASTNKARLQSPTETELKKQQRSRSAGASQSHHEMETRSKSIRSVEDKFSRAVKETKIMRIQSERSAQKHDRAVHLQRRFSVQVRGLSPSQRRINANASRRRSHEMNRTSTTATAAPVPSPLSSASASGMSTPVTDLSRFGLHHTNSISRSPNRCTLKRGRPNTLRSGLARPSPAASSRNASKLNDSNINNATEIPRAQISRSTSSSTAEHSSIAPTPMRRMSSVQDLVLKLEKKRYEKELIGIATKIEAPTTAAKTEPPAPKRTLSRRNSSASKFVKPTALLQKTPKKTPSAKSQTPEGWVPASEFNFESQRSRFLRSLGEGHNEDRDSIQALKTLNAGKVSENVRLFDGMSRCRKSPGKSLIPRYSGMMIKCELDTVSDSDSPTADNN